MSNTAVTLAKSYPHQTTRMSDVDRSSFPKEMHGQFLRYPLECAGYGDYVKLRAKLDALLAAPARTDVWCGKHGWQPVGNKGTAAYCLWHAYWRCKTARNGTKMRVVLVGSEQVIRECMCS